MNELDKIAKALSKCQSELKPVLKTKTNPFFKSTYADLDACWETAREPLTANGLSVTQTFNYTDQGQPILETTLLHDSGQRIISKLPISCPNINDPQKLGATITYYRRYTLGAILGLSPDEDDDGNSTVQSNKPSNNTTKQLPAVFHFKVFAGNLKEFDGYDGVVIKDLPKAVRIQYLNHMVKRGGDKYKVLAKAGLDHKGK